MIVTALAAAWVTGLLMGSAVASPSWALLFLLLAAIALALLLRLRRLPWFPALLAVVVLLGALRLGLPHPKADAQLLAPGQVGVEGLVARDPERLGRAYRFPVKVLRARELSPGATWREASGTVLVTVIPGSGLVTSRGEPYLRYGDLLQLQGRLEGWEEFSNADYRDFLARQGIHLLMPFPQAHLLEAGRGLPPLRWINAARHRLQSSLEAALPEPQAALAGALLLGQRRQLPTDVRDDFITTGTAHLLAISGLHVGVLLGVLLGLARALFGRRAFALLLPLGGIWLYALLSGIAPPVMRASLMGSLYLWAQAMGRQSSGLPLLSVAAALMAGLDPSLLRNVSFQLSFTAMAGLLLLGPPLEGWMEASWLRRLPLGGPRSALRAGIAGLAAGVATTAGTLPLIAFYFNRFSLIGIPVTLVALPALPWLLVASALTALAGLWVLPVAHALGWLAWLPLTYQLGLVQLAARIPGASLNLGEFAPALLWLYYGALLALLLLPVLRGRPWKAPLGAVPALPSARATPIFALALGAVALLLWSAALSRPDGRLHVYVLDVGQGDAILVRSPSGRQLLVDGGPDPRRIARALGERLPFWDRSLDLVVLTHPHEDHLAGLNEVLKRYRQELVLEREVSYRSAEYEVWKHLLKSAPSRVVQAVAGQRLSLGDGVFLEVLNPAERLLEGTSSDEDNNSVVLRLSYGELSFLLAGEIHREAEAMLVGQGAGARATVLKVAHHGSRTSSSEAFVQAVVPWYAVISVGEGNRFGHPHPEVLERLGRFMPGGHILSTAQRGTVHFTADGRRLWLETER